MKVRIGVGLGIEGDTDPVALADVAQACEDLRFDSLWLAERYDAAIPDVVAGLAFVAAKTTRLKLGPGVLVLPGRNPAVVAKQMATLDRLSGGRLLISFGIGLPGTGERELLAVPEGRTRGQEFDRLFPEVRRLLTPGSPVLPETLQQPIDLWIGCGLAPAALERVGRLADGWLPALVTPGELGAAREIIEAAAARAGRTIDPEHFGVSMAYLNGPVPPRLAEAVARRRPGVDPADLFAVGVEGAAERIGRYVEAGFTKFVVRPAVPPEKMGAHLREMADVLLPLQT